MWEQKTKKWLKWFIVLDVVLFVAILGVAGVIIYSKYIKQLEVPSSTGVEISSESQVVKKELRIVSMAPNVTEILYELGLGEQIVGVTKYSNYPADTANKTCVGTFWQPDIEAVLKTNPSLVITLGFEQQSSLADQLNRVGADTLEVPIESIEQLFAGIERIGQKTGRVEQAAALVQRMKAQRQGLVEKYATHERLKVMWVIQRDPLRAAGRKTYVNELFTIINCENAIPETMHRYPAISAEQVLGSGPDVIIEPFDTPDKLAEQQESAGAFYGRYLTTPAVKNNRVYVVDGDYVSRIGPRLFVGLEKIAKLIYPEESTK